MHESPAPPADPDPTLAVVEERLSVGRRTEQTGALRVRIEVDRHDEAVTLEHVADEVSVERVSVGLIVEARREPWHDGAVTVVPVYAEVEVVERRLLLVEEIRLARHTRRTTTTEAVPLARQRAVVERLGADGRWVEDDTYGSPAQDKAEVRASGDPSLPPGDLR